MVLIVAWGYWESSRVDSRGYNQLYSTKSILPLHSSNESLELVVKSVLLSFVATRAIMCCTDTHMFRRERESFLFQSAVVACARSAQAPTCTTLPDQLGCQNHLSFPFFLPRVPRDGGSFWERSRVGFSSTKPISFWHQTKLFCLALSLSQLVSHCVQPVCCCEEEPRSSALHLTMPKVLTNLKGLTKTCLLCI